MDHRITHLKSGGGLGIELAEPVRWWAVADIEKLALR